MLDNILSAAKECEIPKSNVWIFDVRDQPLPEGFKSWKELMGHGEKDWERFDDEKTCKETTAARLYSSGTTGLPKAAVLSHYNFVAQHTLTQECQKRDWEVRARDLLSSPSLIKDNLTKVAKPHALSPHVPRLQRSSRPHLRPPRWASIVHHAALRTRALPLLRAEICHHGAYGGTAFSNCDHHVAYHEEVLVEERQAGYMRCRAFE